MQKKFLIIGIIVLLAIILGGGFLWMQRSKILTNNTQNTDWKTYANTEYGFEFKYPKEWFIEANLGGNKNSIYISPESPSDRMAFTGEALSMSIEVTDPNITILQTVKNMFNLQSGETETKIDFTQENITIGGANGLKIKTICEGVGCGSPEWLVIKNGYLYHFYSHVGYQPTFDQIISTFKFTASQNQTSNITTSGQLSDTTIISSISAFEGIEFKKSAISGFYESTSPRGGFSESIISMNRGDLNGDGLQDAFILSAACGGSCGSYFEIVINQNGSLPKASTVHLDGIQAGGAWGPVENIVINNGVLTLSQDGSTFSYKLVGNNLVRIN